MNKSVEEALRKLPEAKYLYINPVDEHIVKGVTDLTIVKLPQLEPGQFMVSNEYLVNKMYDNENDIQNNVTLKNGN